MMKRRYVLPLLAALLAGTAAAGSVAAQEKKTLALVTNASADFWTIARRGTEKAAAELPNYNVEMYVVSERRRRPSSGASSTTS
jgi:ribose transport system substrate-binding protein